MENVHGVDVSWLHRPHKDSPTRTRAPSFPATPSKDLLPANQRASTLPTRDDTISTLSPLDRVKTEPLPSQSPTTSVAQKPSTPATAQDAAPTRPTSKRPGLLIRSSTDRLQGDGNKSPRRSSWISNISSRFSSTNVPTAGSPATPQVSRPHVNGSHVATPQPDLAKHTSPQPSPTLNRKEAEEYQPYVPQRPKESGNSFFSSVARRLSAGSQTGNAGRLTDNGGVCPRRTLNINPNRMRCLVPELENSKLRRVSFSVDVEIASGPKYKADEPGEEQPVRQRHKKVKEVAEGQALKHPQAAIEEKDEDEIATVSTAVNIEPANQAPDSGKSSDDDLPASPADGKEAKTKTRKQEKKKRSEEERKERKEKKRKKAEENGMVPIEYKDESSADDAVDGSPLPDGTPEMTSKPHDRPTTDPVRIYRRCCQLRESPILKRITEQLMSPSCQAPGEPGTVTCLNLTGSRLQLPDFITLGDWLAIVPVKRLQLEDADIADEGVRVVLSGLMAAKRPEPSRRRSRQQSTTTGQHNPGRAGIIEKLTLKNNPRMTRVGWKHLAVFLHMCKSIKAIDVSMNSFPDYLTSGSGSTTKQAMASETQHDAAEVFAKALTERRGGDTLEELMLSECGLKARQIQKLVDAATVTGVTRLGLAGNDIDDEGFTYVLQYIRSGVCSALDIGHNDVADRIQALADALLHKADCPVWGISLASCDLDAQALRTLFPALVKLQNFRFLDLSHNKRLFESDVTDGVHLIRKYLPAFRNLKRLHLTDVGINSKQAIAIAEVLPECTPLAHISLLENAELGTLVSSIDEASQEEACALFASLVAAVRVSRTIVCVDIDVPSAENSEVVKALAKQVVAYCLRNMERLPLSEAIAHTAASEISAPIRKTTGEDEISVPNVLLHLIGHVDGFHDIHDDDEPAPDDDYIMGGTGVVKALQYCLSERAQETGRRSSGQVSGISTPTGEPHTMPNGLDYDMTLRDEKRRGRAKEMSKNLLGSARKIRARLQPALAAQAAAGDELALSRLTFLDQTLSRMIQRFENEYPECREPEGSGMAPASGVVGFPNPHVLEPAAPPLLDPSASAAVTAGDSDEDDPSLIQVSRRPSRGGSEVNLASKALSIEEGRMHRIGHGIRQDLIENANKQQHEQDESAIANDKLGTQSTAVTDIPGSLPQSSSMNDAHLAELHRRLEELPGAQVQSLMDQTGSYEGVLAKVGANLSELRMLQERDPDGWAQFVQSQMAARANVGQS